MEPARLFDVVSWIGLPGWLLLVFVPRWRWTPLVTACILPSVLAAIYFVLLASNIGTADGGFSSLSGVKQLFAVDALLLAGWIHYLAFDLFVGSWQVRDAQRVGIRHWWVLPCLVLTLMAGPMGLLAYWILRSILVRKPFLRETPAQPSSVA
jgi:hypothetical protein